MFDEHMGSPWARAAALLAAAVVALPVAAQTSHLTVAGFGGNMQKDISTTLWQPAAKASGATLREESHDGSLAQARLQVQSGRPGWDVVHLGADDCAVGEKENLFESIDYKVVKTDGIAASLRGKTWVAQNTYSLVLAYNTEKYKSKPPRTWADFWNTTDYPGRRALQALPIETLEIALLADGVPRERLYPLDTKRAFASLRRIKPAVAVWYATGAQSAQLIRDGEVDMIAIYVSRVSHVIKDGAPVAFTYEGGVQGAGCLAILRGSQNAAVAQKFIAAVTSAEVQARIPQFMPYYGPTNALAYDVGKFPAEVLANSNMSPVNRAKQVVVKVEWWSDHAKEVAEPFRQLIGD